ncbi:hypothetical protein, partial [Burkholderia ubonensis]|uniref:hypothetical protein n=1 Tax=Burkholderia ubonensis TaxID=101571 RepID=UPI0012F85D9A
VKLPANSGLKVDGNGLAVVPDGSKAVAVSGAGVGVVANGARGIMVDRDGVGLVDDIFIRVMCQLHGAQLYGFSQYVAAFVVKSDQNWTYAYLYGRGGAIPFIEATQSNCAFIKNINATHYQYTSCTGYAYAFQQIITAIWSGAINAVAGDQFRVKVLRANEYSRIESAFNLRSA